MKLIVLFVLTFSLNSWATSYDCKYNASAGEGSVEIKTKGKLANVKLYHLDKVFNYNGCKAEKDEIGLLVDCNETAGDLDFMILLNNEVRPASGGIMSSTHELFADIDC